MSYRVTIVYHGDFALCGYPALRDRIAPSFRELERRGLLAREGVRVLEAVPVEEELVFQVHTPNHVRSVQRSDYYGVALLSAGSVLMGAESVAAGESDSAFCYVGTAGHHASREGFWGFCYLNDVAIALADLRRKGMASRVAILDVDPHYGDGTRDILGSDPSVMHVNFYGGHGRGKVEGPHNHDVPLPYDADDGIFLREVEIALQRARSFGPQLLFVILGHDGHRDDYGAFELGDGAYEGMAELVKEYFPLKVVYVLSGGSNPRVACRAIGDVVEVLSRRGLDLSGEGPRHGFSRRGMGGL
jgi:acetoin utilization deacetylase AcuC-like enzyme